jgi:hypothetical protein
VVRPLLIGRCEMVGVFPIRASLRQPAQLPPPRKGTPIKAGGQSRAPGTKTHTVLVQAYACNSRQGAYPPLPLRALP